jgi:hypothetical protein
MSDRLYECGHCLNEYLVTAYAAHVRNCIAKAVAVQVSRKPPRFPEHRYVAAIRIPITLGARPSKALEETA